MATEKAIHGLSLVKALPYQFSPGVHWHTRAPSSHHMYQVGVNTTMERVKHEIQRVHPPIVMPCHAWPTSFAGEACPKEQEGASKSREGQIRG